VSVEAIALNDAGEASAVGANRIGPRGTLSAGDKRDGPAILHEATGTSVIEPGWRVHLDASRNLIVERVEPLVRRVAGGTDADPVMLEIFNNLFMAIAEQMGVALQNTAYSVNIKERLDFSCALFDRTDRRKRRDHHPLACRHDAARRRLHAERAL